MTITNVEASGLLGASMMPPSRWRGGNTDSLALIALTNSLGANGTNLPLFA